jgi:hypothetical protein
MGKLTGLSVTLFTIGGQALVGALEEATYEITNLDEDGSGVNEASEEPELVGRQRRITGTAMVDTVAALITIAESSNPTVAFSFNSGGMLYSGTLLVTTVGHQVRRKSLQKQQFTMKVYGTPTVTAPT